MHPQSMRNFEVSSFNGGEASKMTRVMAYSGECHVNEQVTYHERLEGLLMRFQQMMMHLHTVLPNTTE